MIYASSVLEQEFFGHGYRMIAGTDEVGMGCLAGPVVVAIVLVTPSTTLPKVRDSKTLSEKQRNHLTQEITTSAYGWSIGEATSQEVDALNVRKAAAIAAERAAAELAFLPDILFTDTIELSDFPCPTKAVPKGDRDVSCIAAASILAKVHRDGLMKQYDAQYPGYGFGQHKGYGTVKHLEALRTLGPSTIHRHTYAPVANLLKV